jgi:CHAD domain-containing protein
MSADEAQSPVTVQNLADRVFAELHALILSHEDGAKSGNVESIHDMRVSIRRFRVALSNFSVCLSGQEQRQLRLRLEHLAEALGQVRDLDVMVESLTNQLPSRSPRDRKSIESLIQRLRNRRRGRLRALRRYLGGREYTEFKAQGPHPISEAPAGYAEAKEHTVGQGI